MRNKNFLLFGIALLCSAVSFAQVTVSGVITDSQDNSPLPGVTVLIKNTTKGTVSDIDGKYTIEVDSMGQTLVFQFVGMETIEKPVTSETMNVGMSAGVQLEDVVVTALGISREKKALGYSTQEVSGEEMNNVKYDNVVNSMSGRVAGAQVKQSGNFGGSTNIILRGSTSLTGNNQALFVVDGVPIDNTNSNSTAQNTGRKGYDYGNAVSDLNPDDIESMNVLKGAAATALYGERAANGVIMITTKSGGKSGKKGIGVTFNTNATFGWVDKTTMPKYQENYGAGYGPFYSGGDGSDNAGSGGTKPGLEYYDFDGDGVNDYVVPFTEDASMGQRFDGSPVFQWDALVPEHPNYMKATPWSNSENGPITFFETAQSYTNSLSITGASEMGSFRLSYRNLNQMGILPNSHLVRDNLSLNTTYNATKKLNITVGANYSQTNAKGRNSTGYSDNIMSGYRQWWMTNIDVQEQKKIFEQTGKNYSWNPAYSYGSGDPLQPQYFDNPYWSRYKNYQNDTRNRIYGNIALNYQLTDNLSAMLRFTLDHYSELREERRAVGSTVAEFGVPLPGRGAAEPQGSGYARADRRYSEKNVDFILTYNKDLNENLNLNVMAGYNGRKNDLTEGSASTNGGLIVPDLYSLTNATSTINAERDEEIGVSSVYGAATLGYKRWLFLDVAMRNDWSSTLNPDNRSYFYPAVSGSFIFSEFIENDNISFGKVRLNYAQVGKAAPWGRLNNIYNLNSFTSPTASVNTVQYNPDLKPERTTSIEAGLEMFFFNRRAGFDLAVYQTNSADQIVSVPVSRASGFSSKWMNAGEIENKGVELSLMGTPIKKEHFAWDVTINWAKNTNRVVKLADGITNLQLGSFQGGISINAREGEPYGAITGTDYVYDNGQKVVGADGYYLRTTSNDNIIGNITPDWTGGMTNTFTYKNWAFSFLIDWQKGGDIFSLDQNYGLGTGLYAETDYTNDLGNPVRSPVADGGGTILEGVKEDGSKNDIRVEGGNYLLNGWARNPNKAFIYDASYVKLREAAIHYKLPNKWLEKTFIANATFSIIGSNLWIIHKNLPHADPEAGLSSGNLQGFQSGVLPTTRNVGFNLKINF